MCVSAVHIAASALLVPAAAMFQVLVQHDSVSQLQSGSRPQNAAA